MACRVTKFSHACVLVEDEQHTALFDPGIFAWESGLVSLDRWPKLDYVLITHVHFDHCHEDFAKALATKFPAARFIGPPEVVDKLKSWGIHNVSSDGTPEVDVAPLAHADMAPLGGGEPAQNVRFHYKNLITHPGDSLELTESKALLLLPLAGPWESEIAAVRMGLALQPRFILPIHDWMWNDDWREKEYERHFEFFAGKKITYLKAVNGHPYPVEL